MSRDSAHPRSTDRTSTYTLDEFTATYGLSRKRAEDLYRRFGPSRSKLDVLMSAIRRL
ncbi:hypothetical protein GGE07_000893 [Sinorhizobium terangae]|uniref:hypothetical protein n=1 Tax=Sinorhizobium terangae TaxID=110322 RepID=UPI00142EE2D6|nr:hypothetical protein [Sinorhizobium terangae]MBB4184267.1 hypothetical protein [Sinorhizobium terangae]